MQGVVLINTVTMHAYNFERLSPKVLVINCNLNTKGNAFK